MRKAIPLLWVVGALVFALNTLIVTGHLSGDRYDESAAERRLAWSAALNAEKADAPVEHESGEAAVPLPADPQGKAPVEADESSLQLVSVDPSEIVPDNAELAAIGIAAAVVRVAPSESAAGLFAFPRGRKVRVGQRENGFAQIEDVATGEVGWIKEGALGPVGLEASKQRPKREAYADAKEDQPAVSKPRDKRRFVRERGRRGGLIRRLMGRL